MEEEKKLPKNIRQMAEKEERARVYLEDYVYTFLHKLNCSRQVRTGVLLGRRAVVENKQCWFVKGAVELEDIPESADAEHEKEDKRENRHESYFSESEPKRRQSESETITQQIWNNTQEAIQEYFPECNVCGWFICGSEENFPEEEQLKKTHRQIFGGENCLMYWKQGEEDSFWIEEDEVLLHLKGYFVYYEKNEEMQNYMLSRQKEQSEDVSDQAAFNFRKIMKEKQDEKHPSKAALRAGIWLKAGAAAMFVLLVGGGVLLSRGMQKNEGDSVVALAVGASVERQSGEPEQSSFVSESVTDESEAVWEVTAQDQTTQDQAAQDQTAQDQAAQDQTDQDQVMQDQTVLSDPDKEDAAALQENGIFSGDMLFYKEGLGATVYRITDKRNTIDLADSESTANETSDAKEVFDADKDSDAKNEQDMDKDTQAEPLTVEIPTIAAGETVTADALAEEAAANRPVAYTVQPGDTLIEISRKFYGSSQMVMQIKETNGLDDINKIYIGQELTLP